VQSTKGLSDHGHANGNRQQSDSDHPDGRQTEDEHRGQNPLSFRRINISPEGIEVLTRVGNLLKSMKDKIVRVEGHTDNVAISTKLQDKYPPIGTFHRRANNVVRFLVEKIKLNGNHIEAVGLGEFRPIASNDTRKAGPKTVVSKSLFFP